MKNTPLLLTTLLILTAACTPQPNLSTPRPLHNGRGRLNITYIQEGQVWTSDSGKIHTVVIPGYVWQNGQWRALNQPK